MPVDAIGVNPANPSGGRPGGWEGCRSAGGVLRGEYVAGVREGVHGAGKCLRSADAVRAAEREPGGVTYSTEPGALGGLRTACYRPLLSQLGRAAAPDHGGQGQPLTPPSNPAKELCKRDSG